MPRRKKRWYQPKIDSQSLQSALALFLILLGILTALTLGSAVIGVENTLQGIVQHLLGFASLILPINLIIFGLCLTKITHRLAEPRIAWGLTLLTASVTILFGVFSDTAGGTVGLFVAEQLGTIITRIGVLITSLVFIFISIIIVLNRPLQSFYPFLKNAKERTKELSLNLASKVPTKNSDSQAVTTSNPETKEYAIANNKSSENNSNYGDVEIVNEPSSAKQAVPLIESESPMEFEAPYTLPPLSLLNDSEKVSTDEGSIEKNANTIERTLNNFGIQAKIVEVSVGPAVTQFSIDLAEGTKTSKITNLHNELALSLASPTGSVRIEAPIPGKRLIGIEVPNMSLAMVNLKNIMQSDVMHTNQSKLLVALGEDVSGKPVVSDIRKWPHVLIAGQTGSGKSVLLHSIITSILLRAKPTEVSFILVDPKRVELTNYHDIPHLQTPIIVDPDRTVNAFKWAVGEMEKRYKLFAQIGARSLDDFNEKTDTVQLPFIIIVVDELADLMSYAANEMETFITRIAQKARATGIFMILATQRPSVNVITGLIKANIPARIALNVTSGTDSRVIIDMVGAEKLLGRGDMLYLPPDAGKPKRVQGVYLTDDEIFKVTEHLRQFSSPYQKVRTEAYSSIQTIDEPSEITTAPDIQEPDDNKFLEAVNVILNHDKASASLLQRRLKVGYARAARLLDELEEKGLVGEKDGSNPRDVNREAALNYNQQFAPQNQDNQPTTTL